MPASPGIGTAEPAGFSPYLDTSLALGEDLPGVMQSTGIDEVTLAFVISGDGCRPRWGGTSGLHDNPVAKKIGDIRAVGGDVRVSFGGADDSELGTVCGSVEDLTAAYRTVIDSFGLTRVDFDIEGGALEDVAANRRRSAAVAALQQEAKAADRPLDVSYTLPVMPSGLTESSVDLLVDAQARGVEFSTVNIMTMDYGPHLTGDMGQYAVEAAAASRAQLTEALGIPEDEAWQMLAITAMVGVNDVPGEVFTADNARRLVAFAEERGIGRLSMWSLNRDRPCAEGVKDTVDSRCGSIDQQPLEFTRILAGHRAPQVQ